MELYGAYPSSIGISVPEQDKSLSFACTLLRTALGSLGVAGNAGEMCARLHMAPQQAWAPSTLSIYPLGRPQATTNTTSNYEHTW